MELQSQVELMIHDFLAWLTEISDSNFLESKGPSLQLLNTYVYYYKEDISQFAVFIKKSKELMYTLHQQGFPLTVNGKQVVHFCEPKEQLGEGEMYFQVGRTSPGTLALKFAKRNSEEASPQVSTVEAKDFARAFSEDYFEELRTIGRQSGSPIADGLFQECIVTDVKHSIVTYVGVEQLIQRPQACPVMEDISTPEKTDMEELHYDFEMHCVQESCDEKCTDANGVEELCCQCRELSEETAKHDGFFAKYDFEWSQRSSSTTTREGTFSNNRVVNMDPVEIWSSRENQDLSSTTSGFTQIRNDISSTSSNNQPYPSTREALRSLSGK
ncbi:uncharacterized protein LOC106178892 [Lingula anatina]|uniref:Uncharacterized protein LOC106178892 n=1 Tax=Lingula anatina TaxID=7574 RepID=A0A1S3K4Z3_LINAN|nr:uncharacterized protein LOC106178892 [Lingula anatina]|eukprot:XP_013417708.1 uncharacterized protein LOC106178892 [Lingula anatina]